MDSTRTGRLIAERRKQLNMTQKQLAELLGVTDRAVSRWERGVGSPDISLISPLAAALQISADELLAGEENPRQPSSVKEQPIGIPIFFLYLMIAIMAFGFLLMFLGFCLRSLTATLILVIAGFIIFASCSIFSLIVYRCPLCGHPLRRFYPLVSQYQIQRCRTCGKAFFSDHTVRTPKEYLQSVKKKADAQT